jgi:hypothetical protein
MIDAGFVGGCYGIEEDLVHYSVSEITRHRIWTHSNGARSKRFLRTFSRGVKKIDAVTMGPFRKIRSSDLCACGTITRQCDDHRVRGNVRTSGCMRLHPVRRPRSGGSCGQ